jgi:hypothetical protein
VGKEILGDMAVGGGFRLVGQSGQQDYRELGIKHGVPPFENINSLVLRACKGKIIHTIQNLSIFKR